MVIICSSYKGIAVFNLQLTSEILFFYRYLAHGTATDYIYEIAKVPMAFTFEVCEMMYFSDQVTWCDGFIYKFDLHLQIYGDESAPVKDCFRMFNPTDQTTFKVWWVSK